MCPRQTGGQVHASNSSSRKNLWPAVVQVCMADTSDDQVLLDMLGPILDCVPLVFHAGLEPAARMALRSAFSAGWDAKRARGDALLDQANTTATKRTLERDEAERQRDSAARALVKALAELDRLRGEEPTYGD
jgi:hypothetical protein